MPSTRTRQRDRRTKDPNYATRIEDTLAGVVNFNGTYESFQVNDAISKPWEFPRFFKLTVQGTWGDFEL